MNSVKKQITSSAQCQWLGLSELFVVNCSCSQIMIILPRAISSLDKSETSGTTWEEYQYPTQHHLWLHWLMIQKSKGKKVKQPFRVVTKDRPYLILSYGPNEAAAFRQIRFLSELFQDMPVAPDMPTIHRMIDQALRDLKLMRKDLKKNKNRNPNTRQTAALAVAQSIAHSTAASSSVGESSRKPTFDKEDFDDDDEMLSFTIMQRFRTTQEDTSASSSAASSSGAFASELESSNISEWSIPSSALFDD